MQNKIRPAYFTISKNTTNEIEPIKGSKFITEIFHISSDEQAQEKIKLTKTNYPDARHICWAYRLHKQNITRFSDDGEPSGSAGKPILAPIVGNDLFDVLITVIRYFGGTKLGIGGLVRAYGGSANEGISTSKIITIIPKQKIYFSYSYDDSSIIASALHYLEISADSLDYSDSVKCCLLVADDNVENVLQTLVEYSSNRVKFYN